MPKKSRGWVYVARAAGAIVIGLLVNYGSTPSSVRTKIAEVSAAFIVQLVLIVPLRRRKTARMGAAAALKTIRKGTRGEVTKALVLAEALREDMDRLIPVTYRSLDDSTEMTAYDLARHVAGAPHDLKLVITGESGAGKTILLYRVATEICRRPDRAAVVVPLATYDWQAGNLVEWLADSISQHYGVAVGTVRELIADQRLILLLDGLDEVPDSGRLRDRLFPDSDLPLPDRWRRARARHVVTDPHSEFLVELRQLPSFVVTSRANRPTTIPSVRTAALNDVSFDDARRYLTGTPAALLTRVAQRPLYLNLAHRVHDEIPSQPNESAMRAFLWSARLRKVLVRERTVADWQPDVFERWFTVYATTSDRRGIRAISFQRWPLMYGTWPRCVMRFVKSVVSAGLLALPVAPLLHLKLYLIVTAVLALIFGVAGEGSATRSMALRRFGSVEFIREVGREWVYVVGFVLAAVALSFLAYDPATRWLDHLVGHVPRIFAGHSFALVLGVGVASGLALGLVPTLYELCYVPEHDADRWDRRPSSYVSSTASASVFIGAVGGAIACVPLRLLLPLGLWWSAAVIPVCVLICLIDTLGSPFLAASWWALQRRGPLRVNRFMEQAGKLRLVRSFGQFYLPEHQDFGHTLNEKVTVAPVAAPAAVARHDG